MKKLLRFGIVLLTLVFSFNSYSQCNYTLELYDSFGDGWNGASVDVNNNGTTTNYSIDYVDTVITISVISSTNLSITYNTGTNDDENSYTLFDSNGNTVFSDGPYPTIGLAYSGAVSCPSCPIPNNVFVSNITPSQATINWTTGGASNWNVEIVPLGTSPTGVGVSTSSNPYIATGLNSSTTYRVYVRDSCGAGNTSQWAGPTNFTTSCTAVTAPFTESFDNSSTPSCWTEAGAEGWLYSVGADYGASAAGDHTGNSGNYAWIDGSVPNNTTDASTLTTPFIDISGLSAPYLTYYVFSNNIDDAGNNTFEAEFYDGSTWHTIQTLQGNNGGWTLYQFNLSTYTISGDVQVRFGITENSILSTPWYNDILIDDVSIDEAPGCIPPNSISIGNIGTHAADISWVSGGASNWNVEVVEAGTSPTGNGIATSTNPLSVTGLMSDTNYDVYVQDSCGPGDVSIWVGPVSFTTLISCPEPTGLTISNITGYGADFSWTTGGASNWSVEIIGSGITPTGMGTTVTSPTHTFTGLLPNTTYDVYVQDSCGAGDVSRWAGPETFTTGCPIFIPPYTESFLNFLPGCWEEADNGDTQSGPVSLGFGAWQKDGFANVGSDGAARINIWLTSISDWLISPEIDLSGPSFYQVDFDLAFMVSNSSDLISNLGSDDSLQLLISTDNSVTWNEIAHWTAADTLLFGGSHFRFDLTPYQGDTAVFAFRGSSGAIDDPEDIDVSLDNFVINQIPTCQSPINGFIDDILPSSAKVSWTAGGASNWNVEIVTSGTSPSGTGISVTTNPYTFTGLAAATSYDVYIRDSCGPGDLSTWLGPISFTTPCSYFVPAYTQDFSTVIPNCWDLATGGNSQSGPTIFGAGEWKTDGFANNGNTGAVRINLYTNTKNDWLISPNFDLTTGGPYQVDFDMAFMVWNSDSIAEKMGSDDTLHLLVSSDDGSSWNILNTWTTTHSIPAGGDHFAFDLSAYSNDTIKLAFWATEGQIDNFEDMDISIDNFVVDVLASCPTPNNLLIDSITSHSAQVSWISGGASNWNIEVVPAGSTPTGIGNATANNPHTITGLNASTEYDVYIQDSCGIGDVSNWIGPRSFTTKCPPFVPTYLEDFSNFLPTCWEVANNGIPQSGPTSFGTSAWTNDGFANNSFTGAARINLYSNFTSDWIISPEIDLSGGPFQIEFDLAFMTSGSNTTTGILGVDDTLRLLVLVNNTGSWIPINSWTNQDVIPLGGQHFTFDLSAYSGDTVKFAFWATDGILSNGNNDVDISIDNFKVDIIPTCPVPSSIQITSITETSANILWTTGGASNWNIEIVEAGATPTGVGVPVTTIPYQATNLMGNTGYDVYVQDSCGIGDVSTWIGPETFVTNCGSTIQGDSIEDAISVVGPNFTHVGNTDCYTDQFTTSGSPDVWFLLITDSCTENIDVSLCDSDYDTRLYLLDGSGAEITNDDDGCGNQSRILNFQVNGGDSVYIVVDGFSLNGAVNSGIYELVVTENGATGTNAGTDNNITVCDTLLSIDLFSNINGTPDSLGNWIDVSSSGAITNGSLDLTMLEIDSSYSYRYELGSGACINSSTLTVTVEKCVPPVNSIYEALSAQLLSYYPNPVTTHLNIEYIDKNGGVSSFQIFDLSGRIVLTKEITPNRGLNKQSLPVNNLVQGVYYLKVNETVVRFIKQ